MMISAFEKLLNCNSGKEDELVKMFLEFLKPNKDFKIDSSNRIMTSKYNKSGKSLREIWLRDFYQLRSDYAHGRRISGRPRIWNPDEHLLIGSYCFPLLLKSFLANRDYYVLAEEDNDDIEVFERRAESNIFNKITNSDTWPWNELKVKYIFEEKMPKMLGEAIGEIGEKPNNL